MTASPAIGGSVDNCERRNGEVPNDRQRTFDRRGNGFRQLRTPSADQRLYLVSPVQDRAQLVVEGRVAGNATPRIATAPLAFHQ